MRHTHTHNVYVHVCNYIHEIVHLHRFYFACIIWSIKMFNIFNMEMFKTGVHVEIYLLILALPRQQWWYHQTALLSCATSHINSFRTHYNSEFYLSLNNISITQLYLFLFWFWEYLLWTVFVGNHSSVTEK